MALSRADLPDSFPPSGTVSQAEAGLWSSSSSERGGVYLLAQFDTSFSLAP